MNDKNQGPVDDSTDTNDMPKFATMDEVVNYVSGQIDQIKKLSKPDKKNRATKDDFKLYHEQTETKLMELNDRIDGLQSMFDTWSEKLKGAGSSPVWNSVVDFLFKP